MPKGPPPYPVTYKEFFITDPKTGKQTMKIQMYPSQNEAVGDDTMVVGGAEDLDDFDIDEHDWLTFLDAYQKHGGHGEFDTPWGHAIASDYYDYEKPAKDPRNPEFQAMTHDEHLPDFEHLRSDLARDKAFKDPHNRQFGYLVHEKPHYVPDHDAHADHEMQERLTQAHLEREAKYGHYEGYPYHGIEEPHHEDDEGYNMHLDMPHHAVEGHHYPQYYDHVLHQEPHY